MTKQTVNGYKKMQPSTPQNRVHQILAAALSIAAALAMSLVPSAHADLNTNVGAMRHEPYRVLIPVDDEQRVVGENVWVSTQFYNLLTQSGVQTRRATGGSVITAATYRATLAVSPLTQTLALQTCTVTFTIDIKRPKATIVLPPLPLAPSGSTPNTATWDATPISPRFLPSDRGIEFVVENQTLGRHELEIVLSPMIDSVGDLRQCNFPVPRVTDATLILQFPSDAATPKVSESLGGVTVSPSNSGTSELTARVGPVSTLAVSWFERRAKAEQASLEVDQLLWLWCRAHQTNLRAQWEFRVLSGTVSQLQIVIDPRFRLSGQYHCYHVPERRLALADTFPDEPTEIPITSVELVPLSLDQAATHGVDTGQATVLNLAMPVSGTILVCGDFVLRHFGGIGQIQLPHIAPVSGRVSKSLLMTSCEPSLKLQITGAATEQSQVATSEFVSQWERFRPRVEPPDLPQRAFSMTTMPRDGVVSIEAAPATVRAVINESVAFNGQTAEVIFDATITPSRELFSQTLSLPKTMAIDSVELLDASSQRIEFRSVTATPNRTLTSPDVATTDAVTDVVSDRQNVHIFLKRPLATAATIRVRGAVPTPPNIEQPTPLPRVELVGTITTAATLAIYRTSDVLVSVDASKWMSIDRMPTSPFDFAEMIFVGRYVTPVATSEVSTSVSGETSGEAAPVIAATPLYTLTENHPQIHGKIVETLRHLASTETWSAQWELTLDIQDGEVAIIPILLDSLCTGPLQVEPSTIRVAEDAVIDGKRRVVLMLRDPASGHVAMTITSAVRQGDKEIILPQLQMDREFASLKRFLAVPTFAKGAIQWEISGAVAADPTVHSDLLRAGEQLFVVQGDAYAGRGQVIGSGGTIRLLDVRFFVRNDGEFFAFATCDAEGGLGRRIVVSLPPTTPMIEVSMSGITVPIPNDQRHRLSLTVGAYPMPQRLDIVYHGHVERRVRSGEKLLTSDLPIPKLDGITVQETLWTVALEMERGVHPEMSIRCGDDDLGIAYQVVVPRDTTSLMATLAALRLERMLVSLEQVPKEIPRENINVRRWFGHWERQWNEQTFFLDRLLGDEPELTTTSSLGRTLIADGSALGTDDGSAAAFVRSIRSLDSARNILQTRFRTWLASFDSRGSASSSTLGTSSPEASSLATSSPTIGTESSLSDGAVLSWLTRERTTGWGPLTSIESWSDRNHCGTAFFAGVSRGGLGRLQLTTAAQSAHHWGDVSRVMPIWIGLLILSLALPLSVSLRQTISMTPHFWSVWLGLLLWCLSPPGTLGLMWVGVTLASLVVPLWRRRFRRPHAAFPARA
ncbi:MAG: hypothetical protein ACRC46_08645 [Thermoguttaceae bacterium]